MLDLNNIDLMLWDLDGVIYVRDIDGMNAEKVHEIFGEAISKLDSKISAEEGLDIINKYYPESPSKFYHNIERDYGINRFELDNIFHEILVKKANFAKNGYIEEEYVNKFKSLSPKHIILTQSNQIWAKNILSDSNLSDQFDSIIGSEVTLEKPKMLDNDLYIEICNELNIAPERAVMIEDSYKNLKAAKKHGLQTVLFNYDKDINEDYIDYQYRDIRDFLTQL